MSTATPSLDGHVVHLLQHWGDAAAPETLRIRPRLGSASRAALAVLLFIASAIAVFLIAILWVFETPGWWFSLLFTVMIGGLTCALWFGYIGAIRSGVRRENAIARWAELAVRASDGVIVARDVVTSDDGSVPRFELTVRTELGTVMSGQWVAQHGRYLLQPQVPGVGSPVRVWRDEQGLDTDPLVIEALDPTVVTGAGGEHISKYLD